LFAARPDFFARNIFRDFSPQASQSNNCNFKIFNSVAGRTLLYCLGIVA
jgi:hypothetical protein